MKQTLILFTVLCSITYGQEGRFRFQTSFGFHSTMYGGTRSFENVNRLGWEDLQYYDYEEYKVDYQNFSFSAGFNLKFSLNWINNKSFILRQSSSLTFEIYEQKIDYTLTYFEEYDTVISGDYYSNDLVLNDVNTGTLNGIGWVVENQLIYLHKLDKSWLIGGGLSYNWARRNDWHFRYSNSYYAPNHTRYTWGRYTTRQLGIVFQIEKVYSNWSVYFNLNQSFITLKSNENKGGDYFSKSEGEHLNPLSHNLDFRFPLYIQFGGAYQFGKIKK